MVEQFECLLAFPLHLDCSKPYHPEQMFGIFFGTFFVALSKQANCFVCSTKSTTMQPKKNPKIDLRKNSKIYFAIGLCLMLFLAWQSLEWKTYSKKTISEYELNVDPQEIEEIPVTNLTPPPPPPPPPPVAPEVFNVIDNEKNEEETFIETSDTNQEEVIVPVEHVDVADEVEDVIEVPFTIIEQAPVFPGCENMSKSKQRDCFQEKMKQHINKHFQYPEMAQELGIQGRVNVRFVIDERGKITEIQARGPDRNLEEEAKRIIKLLPTMIPGKQRERHVRVPYGQPIMFKLQ